LSHKPKPKPYSSALADFTLFSNCFRRFFVVFRLGALALFCRKSAEKPEKLPLLTLLAYHCFFAVFVGKIGFIRLLSGCFR